MMCEHHALKQKDHFKLYVYRVCLKYVSHSVLLEISLTTSSRQCLSSQCPLPDFIQYLPEVCKTCTQRTNLEVSRCLPMHQGLFCSVLLDRNGNSEQVMRAMFQPACLGLLVQTAIWLAALINQASGVDGEYFQPAGWAIKSKTQQEPLINSMKQSSEN